CLWAGCRGGRHFISGDPHIRCLQRSGNGCNLRPHDISLGEIPTVVAVDGSAFWSGRCGDVYHAGSDDEWQDYLRLGDVSGDVANLYRDKYSVLLGGRSDHPESERAAWLPVMALFSQRAGDAHCLLIDSAADGMAW